MDVEAITRYARLSPTKARDLARRMTGLPVSEALQIVQFSERKAAALLAKTLKSAVANAEHNDELPVESLRVKTAVVDEGPRLKRYWPRARGGASPILKRTCHIRIVVTDGQEAEEQQNGL